ncbi:MAG: hypothetical protein ACFHU9_02505 [Fluviicola sp.]
MKLLIALIYLVLPSLMMAQGTADTLFFHADVDGPICGVGLKYPKGSKLRHQEILARLDYSQFADFQDSVLIAEFKIDRNGRLGSIDLYESENEQAFNEVTRVLESFKQWNTMRSDRMKLKTLGVLVIDLRSE